MQKIKRWSGVGYEEEVKNNEEGEEEEEKEGECTGRPYMQ